MILTRTAAPAETPIAVAALKEHLRITHSAEDAFLATLVAAVTDELDANDGYLRRALVTQSWRLEQRHFPPNTIKPWALPLPPLQTVDSIQYYDGSNALQTVSADLYTVQTPRGAAGHIVLKDNLQWPDPYDRVDAVRVNFTCGYGAAADVPAQLVHGFKLMCAELYTQRGTTAAARGVSEAVKQRMLGPYRWAGFA